MPRQKITTPGTMVVACRLPLAEAEAAQRMAEARGSNVSREIRRALRALVAAEDTF